MPCWFWSISLAIKAKGRNGELATYLRECMGQSKTNHTRTDDDDIDFLVSRDYSANHIVVRVSACLVLFIFLNFRRCPGSHRDPNEVKVPCDRQMLSRVYLEVNTDNPDMARDGFRESRLLSESSKTPISGAFIPPGSSPRQIVAK